LIRLLILGGWLAGCADRPLRVPEADAAVAPDLSAAPDLAAAPDLPVMPDLATDFAADLATDLPAPDLRAPVDLAAPADLAWKCGGAGDFPCLQWAHFYGDDGSQTVSALATDQERAIVAFNVETGGQLQFPGEGADGAGSYLASIGADESVAWQLALGPITVADLAVDAQGGIFVAARLKGATTLAGVALNGAGFGDALLIKVDRAGTVQWAHLFDDPDRGLPISVAVSPSGNVILTGRFTQTIDFGSGVSLTNEHTHATLEDFVASFDGDGNAQWARQTRGDWVTYTDNAVTSDGKIFLAGQILGSGDPGGGAIVSSNSDAPDDHLLVLSPGGAVVSAQLIGADSYAVPRMSVTASGAVAVWLSSQADFSFAGQSVTADSDAVLLWDQNAVPLSAHVLSSPASIFGQIAASADGRLAVSSIQSPFTVIGVSVLTLAGSASPSFAILDGAANRVASVRPARDTFDARLSFAFTPSGGLWLAGWADGVLDPGLGPLTPAGLDALLGYYRAPNN
jgi:hypothetical protein